MPLSSDTCPTPYLSVCALTPLCPGPFATPFPRRPAGPPEKNQMGKACGSLGLVSAPPIPQLPVPEVASVTVAVNAALRLALFVCLELAVRREQNHRFALPSPLPNYRSDLSFYTLETHHIANPRWC